MELTDEKLPLNLLRHFGIVCYNKFPQYYTAFHTHERQQSFLSECTRNAHVNLDRHELKIRPISFSVHSQYHISSKFVKQFQFYNVRTDTCSLAKNAHNCRCSRT